MLIKRSMKANPAYGIPPEKRSLEMHMSLGAINLNKTSGPTSHEVAAWVKRILEVEKAGHSGTLDPKVTGILPVLFRRCDQGNGHSSPGRKGVHLPHACA